MKIHSKLTTVKILGIPLTCCEFDDILVKMDKGIKNGSHGNISITNTESIYHATRIPSHFQYIKNASFSCCDGIAVVLAGKMIGIDIPRLHGPDLMLKCCEYGVNKKWRHFFYGGKEGVPELLSKELTKKTPVKAFDREQAPEEDRKAPDRAVAEEYIYPLFHTPCNWQLIIHPYL